jgi:hypothetical protein
VIDMLPDLVLTGGGIGPVVGGFTGGTGVGAGDGGL